MHLADPRFDAFLDELKTHRIRFDDRLILDGDFSAESGRADLFRQIKGVLLGDRGGVGDPRRP